MYSDVIRSDEYRQQILDFIRLEYGIEEYLNGWIEEAFRYMDKIT